MPKDKVASKIAQQDKLGVSANGQEASVTRETLKES